MKQRRTILASLLVLLVLLTGCLGPSPIVEQQTLVPPDAPGKPFQIECLIVNHGGGEGTIRVTGSLKNKRTGLTLVRANETVYLRDNERLTVVISLDPPPSAGTLDPGDVQPDVTAEYPIQ